MIEDLIQRLIALEQRIADLERTERPLIASGLHVWSGPAAASGNVTVTFGVTFAANPRIYVSVNNTDANISATFASVSTTQATIYWKTIGGGTKTAINFDWLAIGGG